MTDKDIEILYVDDEPNNLLLLTRLFRKKYTVLQAASGEQGLKMLAGNPDVKVVISDMNMPGMNGIDFINKARALYPTIRYFVLTGYDITPEINLALESGIIAKYFSKPFDIKEIDESINAVLE